MSQDSAALAGPPVAPRRPGPRTFHGHTFVDEYEWLRDKDDPATIGYLEAENRWTAQRTAHLSDLREEIYQEIASRTLETDMSVPVRSDGYWYFARTTAGKQYPAQARVPVVDESDWTPPQITSGVPLDGEEIFFDSNTEAEGHDFYSLGSFSLNKAGTLLAYATDTQGDERYQLRIRDLRTGQDLPEVIDDTSSGAVLTPDGRFVFYTTVDDAWRPDRVWRHEVGTPVSDDVMIFHEPDERFWVGVGFSRTEAYLHIETSSKVTSETLLVSLSDPTCDPLVVWPRRDGIEYSVDHAISPDGESLLVICHNERHQDFELAVSPVPSADTGLDPAEARTVLVPEPGQRIEAIDSFATFLAVSYRDRAVPRVAVLPITAPLFAAGTSWQLTQLELGDELTSIGVGANAMFDQPMLRVGAGSFIAPARVYDIDVASGAAHLRKEQPVLGGYSPADYDQRRLWATADDGTQVPISVVWRRDKVSVAVAADGAVTLDAPAPLRLYGYGAYEFSIDPGMSIPRLSALDRGVVFAVAHVRGGGELGRHWYEQGRREHKPNTFSDFVACGRYLVETGWTAPDRMVAEGGSAGGLLVGAAINLAPELFAGAVADVPFVDPLTSILDPSLPLTVTEWDEWGDPLHNPAVYELMRAYSPYENVHEGVQYPKILAVTSLNDTRVLYVEPAKWVARLRQVGADVLLKTEMSAGHGGVSGRYQQWREVAFELAWTFDVVGVR